MNESEHVQDPSMPPDWHCWNTGEASWHARPPGEPNAAKYVHATTKQAVADKAWHKYRLAVDAQS